MSTNHFGGNTVPEITREEHDGALNAKRTSDVSMAMKITVDGLVTYLAVSFPGTAEGAELWQCRKIDETTGTVITWADGNDLFDNVATDLTALNYL